MWEYDIEQSVMEDEDNASPLFSERIIFRGGGGRLVCQMLEFNGEVFMVCNIL